MRIHFGWGIIQPYRKIIIPFLKVKACVVIGTSSISSYRQKKMYVIEKSSVLAMSDDAGPDGYVELVIRLKQ